MRSYPAVFAPPLVSVDKGPFAESLEFAYVLRDQIEFQAFGRGYLGPFARRTGHKLGDSALGRHRRAASFAAAQLETI